MKTSSLSNAQLQDLFMEQLALNHPVVVAHHVSKDASIVRIELAQFKASSSSGKSKLSQMESDFRPWALPLFRAWMPMETTSALEELPIGSVLENSRLVIKDQLTPHYTGQLPRMTSEGCVLVDDNGLAVYRMIHPAYCDEQFDDFVIAVHDSGDAFDQESED